MVSVAIVVVNKMTFVSNSNSSPTTKKGSLWSHQWLYFLIATLCDAQNGEVQNFVFDTQNRYAIYRFSSTGIVNVAKSIMHAVLYFESLLWPWTKTKWLRRYQTRTLTLTPTHPTAIASNGITNNDCFYGVFRSVYPMGFCVHEPTKWWTSLMSGGAPIE